MPSSSFHKDLSKEEILGTYLDDFYTRFLKNSTYSIERINDLNLQHQGVDLILKNKNHRFYVDEKAQLDYLNSTLPTFAFELSYLKKNSWRKGWLHDESKITNVYFLVTEIMVIDKKDISKGVNSFKITAIYRDKLIKHLNSIGLTEKRLSELEKEVRDSKIEGRAPIKELNVTTEGNINFSSGKNEKPINLILKLNYLIENGIGAVLKLH